MDCRFPLSPPRHVDHCLFCALKILLSQTQGRIAATYTCICQFILRRLCTATVRVKRNRLSVELIIDRTRRKNRSPRQWIKALLIHATEDGSGGLL